jgi:hypothetical protein
MTAVGLGRGEVCDLPITQFDRDIASALAARQRSQASLHIRDERTSPIHGAADF